jgi:isochorismate synthase
MTLAEAGSLALWKLPDSQRIQLIANFDNELKEPVKPLEELGKGFLISPFQPDAKKSWMPAHIHYSYSNGPDVLPEISGRPEISRIISKFDKEKETGDTFKWHFSHSVSNGTDKKNFIELVEKGIAEIRSRKIHKIVPARSEILENASDKNWFEIFQILCEKYPGAFVSLISTPEHGTWLGATPELLAYTDVNGIFKTSALAGTQVYHDHEDLTEIRWSQKEIEEQALVSRFIINCFKKIRLREFDEVGPKTMRAGNLVHLKTDYIVNMHQTNFPELGQVMLDLLHPTSAVCGMPKNPSLEFLKEHENLDRRLFAGYIGPVGIDGSNQIFVNLRCMYIRESQVELFAGAGLTADSIPEREWEETESKLNTLRKVL